MKIADIRKLTTSELTKETVKLKDEIAELRRHIYMGDNQNVRAVRNKRKDLSRMLTVLSEYLVKEAK
ncbi:50S ribosomal protein L29 [Candidatus Saccharibacteria bacterium]|nr:MAG: 50S ribosomal protein L29 [Candidatus Saccharibacteria bacterium]